MSQVESEGFRKGACDFCKGDFDVLALNPAGCEELPAEALFREAVRHARRSLLSRSASSRARRWSARKTGRGLSVDKGCGDAAAMLRRCCEAGARQRLRVPSPRRRRLPHGTLVLCLAEQLDLPRAAKATSTTNINGSGNAHTCTLGVTPDMTGDITWL